MGWGRHTGWRVRRRGGKLSAFARAAGDARCIRALTPLEWVSLTLPEQACVVGDDEVGFAASTNSGDKRRRGVHADSRQGRRWHLLHRVRTASLLRTAARATFWWNLGQASKRRRKDWREGFLAQQTISLGT